MAQKGKQSSQKSTEPAQPASGPASEPTPNGLEKSLRLLARFRRFYWDIGGVACLALAFMTLLALLIPSWSAGLLRWWVDSLQRWLGWGSVWIVSAITVVGLWMLFHQGQERPPVIRWGRVLALEIAALASIGVLTVFGGASIVRAEAGLDGGRIGWGIVELLQIILAPVGLSGLFWIGALLLVIFTFSLAGGIGLAAVYRERSRRLASEPDYTSAAYSTPGPVVSASSISNGKTQPVAVAAADARKKRPILPPEFRKNFRLEPEEEPAPGPRQRDERLPPVDLLMPEQSARQDERNINLTAGLIEKTLSEFGIPAKVVGFRVGPTVTSVRG